MGFRQVLGIGLMTVGTCAALLGTANHLIYNNVTYETSTKKVAAKADGIFDATELTEYNDGTTEIGRSRNITFRTPIYYTDYNDDYLVDKIYEQAPNSNEVGKTLKRKVDFKTHQKEFERADQEFIEQMARLRHLL